MTYELAKQLKDAGFPKELITESNGIIFGPSLSELIEACRDGFVSLDRFRLSQLGLVQYVCNHEKAWRTEGKTPEEAVAKLWLELNK